MAAERERADVLQREALDRLIALTATIEGAGGDAVRAMSRTMRPDHPLCLPSSLPNHREIFPAWSGVSTLGDGNALGLLCFQRRLASS